MEAKANKIKVLMIDDNRDLCQVIKDYLEKTGKFEVPIFTDAKSGISYARTKKPDVILLDLMMPEMDGTEAAEELMESDATSEIPIIFITAAIKRTEVENNLGYIHGRPIIAKPVLPGEIIKRIESVLGVRPGQPPAVS